MKFLEHELAAQERELNAKQDTQNAATPDKTEEKEALELRVRELEAMVKGITDELLDLKSVTRRLGMQIEKLGGAPVKSHPETAARFAVRRSEITAEENEPEQHSPVSQELPPREIRRTVQPEPVSVKRPISAPVREVKHTPVPEPEEEIPTEDLKPSDFEYVMQQDGSIQKRRKTGNKTVIIAGTGFAPSHASRSSAIRADSSAVIEAEEDDSKEIK
ncbi:MAG: hypothetical protein Q4Q53_03815 [Methanocorpusculum sp.]|nr:hypothetical protein [Methanocorpusculum sp.]